MKSFNYVYLNQYNRVSIIVEFNLLNGIINLSKHTKNINSHYYLILYEFMNIHRGKEKVNNFQILLDSRCSSTILMRSIIAKLKTKKDYLMQWQTQAGNLSTNIKVKIYCTLPNFSVANIVMWYFQVFESAKGRYDVVLGRDLITALGLNIKSQIYH